MPAWRGTSAVHHGTLAVASSAEADIQIRRSIQAERRVCGSFGKECCRPSAAEAVAEPTVSNEPEAVICCVKRDQRQVGQCGR